MAPAGEATGVQNGLARVMGRRIPIDSTEKIETRARPRAEGQTAIRYRMEAKSVTNSIKDFLSLDSNSM